MTTSMEAMLIATVSDEIPVRAEKDALSGPIGFHSTRMLVAKMPWMRQMLYSSYQPHWKPTETLSGKCTQTGAWNTAKAKVYPEALSKVIAASFIEFSNRTRSEGGDEVPSEVHEAIQALDTWDPYMVDQDADMQMQADYHPHLAV